jgi:hypothetical protein
MSAKARIAVALLALALGCGARGGETPQATVDAYFRALARDPIRQLPLLTPAFHQQHGIGVVTAAQAQRIANSGATTETTEAITTASVDRLQLGWLAVQAREEFRALRDRFGVTPGAVTEDGTNAVVTVQVQPQGAPAFEQRFMLSRAAPGGAWRIDSVEQRGVVAENRATAFVAHPSEATRRQLAQPAGNARR